MARRKKIKQKGRYRLWSEASLKKQFAGPSVGALAEYRARARYVADTEQFRYLDLFSFDRRWYTDKRLEMHQVKQRLERMMQDVPKERHVTLLKTATVVWRMHFPDDHSFYFITKHNAVTHMLQTSINYGARHRCLEAFRMGKVNFKECIILPPPSGVASSKPG